MPAYWIARSKINEAESYKKYTDQIENYSGPVRKLTKPRATKNTPTKSPAFFKNTGVRS